MASVEIAWAAGLFEGEGCCTISNRYQPRVQLTMTDEDAVRRFAAAVGRGEVRHYEGSTANRKNTWQWSVQSRDDVLHVLGQLWPFLCERRRERAYEVIERAAKMNDGLGFCARGHDLSVSENVYLHVKSGKRYCVPCRNRRARERRTKGSGVLG